jgi:hypothetical protein
MAEIDGDHVTIHNVRNCDYRTEGDYTPHWETRSYDLAQIRGMDIFSDLLGLALDCSSHRQFPVRRQ